MKKTAEWFTYTWS